MSSPEYQGQDIHLEDPYPINDDYDVYTYKEELEGETSDTEPITSCIPRNTYLYQGPANPRNFPKCPGQPSRQDVR